MRHSIATTQTNARQKKAIANANAPVILDSSSSMLHSNKSVAV